MNKRFVSVICISLVLCLLIITALVFLKKDSSANQVSNNPKDYQIIRVTIGSEKIINFQLGEENIASITYLQESDSKEDVVCNLDSEQVKTLQKFLCDYCKIIERNSPFYWPSTDEYPEMKVLWRVDFMSVDADFSYHSSGAQCYPEYWDTFIKELEAYIHS